MEYMICYFLRHGQSQANADGVLAGQLNSPLTSLGRDQAHLEGQRLQSSGAHFDIIISSPLTRAHDTAIIVAKALSYPLNDIVVDSRLVERNVGPLEGRPSTLLADAIRSGMVGIETNSDMAARCQAVLNSLRGQYGNKSVLIVAHAGVGEAMRTLGRPIDTATDQSGLSIPNAVTFQLL